MILSGREISQTIIGNLKNENSVNGSKLVVISVGYNKSAMSYLNGIISKAKILDVIVEHINLDENINNEEYIKSIEYYNSHSDAILLFTPLPNQLDFELISKYIEPSKDVDCLTKYNSGNFYLTTDEVVAPCTAKAVMEVFKVNNYNLTSKKVCIVGASNIVGKPLAKLMLDANATVTVCNYHTIDLEGHTKASDIVIAACGVAKLIKKEHLKENAVVIDVGINFIDGKLCGDVDYEDCLETTQYITPVPGGIGSITSTIIFQNMSLLKKL